MERTEVLRKVQELLSEMKQQKVSPGRKGYEKHFLLDNVEVTVGVGGIHTKNEPEKIIPKEDELLLDSDVNSLPTSTASGTKQGNDEVSCLPCGKGSTALSIATGKVFMLNSSNVWTAIGG